MCTKFGRTITRYSRSTQLALVITVVHYDVDRMSQFREYIDNTFENRIIHTRT